MYSLRVTFSLRPSPSDFDPYLPIVPKVPYQEFIEARKFPTYIEVVRSTRNNRISRRSNGISDMAVNLIQHHSVESSASTMVSSALARHNHDHEGSNFTGNDGIVNGEAEGGLVLQRILSGSSGTDEDTKGQENDDNMMGRGEGHVRTTLKPSGEKGAAPEISMSVGDPPDKNKVDWDGPDDPANPQNWSDLRKWYVTLMCALLTINV